MRARKIVHVDLEAPLAGLSPDPGFEGLYVVFWHRGAPVAHRDVANRALPLPEAEVEAIRAQARRRPDLRPAVLPARAASVVVCTRDRPGALAQCLDSLAALEDRPGEVVVVDNAPSTPAAHTVVGGRPGVRYVLEPRAGLDRARNRGVLESRGEVVAFVDDDVTVAPSWLGRLLAGFTGPEVAAVTGLVLPAELDTEAQLHFETRWGFGRGYEPRSFGPGLLARRSLSAVPVWDVGAGASMAFRREVFDRVGGFDERLDVGAAGCSGDTEMWYRILAEGGTCLYEPSAVAFHAHRRDRDSLARQLQGYMRGHVAALLIQYERYGRPGELVRVLVALPLGYLRTVARGLVHGFDLGHRLLPYEVRGCLSGVLFYLRHRRPRRAGAGGARPVLWHVPR